MKLSSAYSRLAAWLLVRTRLRPQSPPTVFTDKSRRRVPRRRPRLDRKDLAAAQARFTRAATPRSLSARTTRSPSRSSRDRRIGDLIQQAAQARLSGAVPRSADALLAEAHKVDPTQRAGPRAHAPNVPRRNAARAAAAPANRTSSRCDPHRAQRVRNQGHPPARRHPPGRQPSSPPPYGVKTGSRRLGHLRRPFALRPRADHLRRGHAHPAPFAHLFAVPVRYQDLLLVAKDTLEELAQSPRAPGRRDDLSSRQHPRAAERAHQVVKSVFDIKQAVVSPLAGTASAPRARADHQGRQRRPSTGLLDRQAEVVLELKLFSIDKSHLRNTGATPPTAGRLLQRLFRSPDPRQSPTSPSLNQAIASGLLHPHRQPHHRHHPRSRAARPQRPRHGRQVLQPDRPPWQHRQPHCAAHRRIYLGSGATSQLRPQHFRHLAPSTTSPCASATARPPPCASARNTPSPPPPTAPASPAAQT